MSRSLLESFVSLVSAATVERIGWLLVHSLWQFAAIALVALFLDRVLKRRTAALRYATLLVGLLMMVTTPFVTWLVLPDSLDVSNRPDLSIVEAAPANLRYNVAMTNGKMPTFVPPTVGANSDNTVGEIETSAIMTAEATLESETWLDRLTTMLNPWLATIVGIWCIGVVLFSLRPLVGWINVHRLTTTGVSPVSSAVQDAFDRVQRRLKIVRRVQVLQSIVVNSPIVVGCFRSTILLPASFIAGVPVSQLEAILAHELAHVRRYDYLANLLQTLVETLFFYHPAVWWISHRIRDERENCCDDLVVAALGNKIEYGRALLAVEQFRRDTTSSLALSAKGGSLLARVKRLFADPVRDNRSSPGLVAIGILLAMTTVAGVWTTVIADVEEGSSQAVAVFGPQSHGLQFRLVALSPDINDHTPDLKSVMHDWAQSKDMTFGIELKNVNTEPLTLAGVRYGDNFAKEVRGTLRTEMIAPHWFAFEFTDMDGKPVPRTHCEYYQQWNVVDSASTHELEPGQSLIEVLRPVKFNAPMDYDLPPGKYKVRVRYHGPDDSLRENVRKHWPDKAILNAWPHDVVSNSVEFEVKQPSRRTKPEDLVWGKSVDGLQAALEYRLADDVAGNPLESPGVRDATSIGVKFHVRNASDKPITFVSETGRQGDYVHIVNERGEKVDMPDSFFSGAPIDVAWKLEPGEIAQLSLLTPGLGSLHHPGKYTVHYTVRFNSRQQKDDAGNVIFPRPGDYDKELDTGDTPLFLYGAKQGLSSRVSHKKYVTGTVRDPDGQPVTDANIDWVYEGATHGRLERSGNTDSEGRFAILRESQPAMVRIASADRSLGAIVSIDDDDEQLDVDLKPTYSAHGRLLKLSGEPFAGAKIAYNVRVYRKDTVAEEWVNSFGDTVTTDIDGQYTLQHWAQGIEYNVTVELGEGRWRVIHKAISNDAVPLDLGEHRFDERSGAEPTYLRVAAAFRDERPVSERLESLKQEATDDNKRIAVIVADPDSKDAVWLYLVMRGTLTVRKAMTNKETLNGIESNMKGFKKLWVDVKKLDKLQNLLPLNDLKSPVTSALLLFETDGTPLYTYQPDQFEDGPQKVEALANAIQKLRGPGTQRQR